MTMEESRQADVEHVNIALLCFCDLNLREKV